MTAPGADPIATGGPTRPSGGPARGRQIPRWLVLTLGGIVVLFALVVAVVLVRYLPALDDARVLRSSLERAAARLGDAGLDLDGSDVDAAQRDLGVAAERRDRLVPLLRDDPLIALLRLLPPSRPNVLAADRLAAAADELVRAGSAALIVGERYAAIRDGGASEQGGTFASLVELMAESGPAVDDVVLGLSRARLDLESMLEGIAPQLAVARDAVLEKLDRYEPLLVAYARADGIMAAALGTSGPRRYLVLAQDPAELRPTGGFVGTVGVVEFDGGRIVERRFQGVDIFDGRADLPYVEPPAPLAGHLLGDESWRLADANWSPDFPTAARQSLELYELQTGDRSIDGVVALTTYAIDALLEVTGPVDVPGYGVTVRAGETTLTGLQQTRSPLAPGGDRKAFLDELAGVVIDRLMTLPPGRWGEVIPALQRLGRERLASVWLRDPRAQALVAEARLDGAIRGDAGDYVYAVDANVGPVSKLSLVTERRLALRVTLDPIGNAHNSLELSWDNAIRDGSGEPQRTLLAYQDREIMGLFVRLIVPERSRLESVSGGELTRIEGPELIETEAGRTVFGNYLMVPPGSTTLRYAWVSPYPAEIDGTRGVYRLTIQKQPGTVDQRLRVEIGVPPGAEIVEASPTLAVEGRLATFDGSLTVDVELQVEYRLTP